MEGKQAKLSILMFPWLAHGHIFPFLELAKILSKRNFIIHICSAPVNLDSIKVNLANDESVIKGSINLIELEFESPELPPEFHTTKNLPSHLIPVLIQDFQKTSSSFFSIVSSLKPDLLILDYFQPWAFKYALSRGIPAVCFLVVCATGFAFHHHEHKHGRKSPFPYKGIYLLDHERVDFVAIMGALMKEADVDAFAFGMFDLSSEFVLFHSSKALEGKYIDYLTVQCKKQIVPTGPLIVHSNVVKEDSEIIKWLDGKDQFSVVYVSFGSEYFLSKEEIYEVAKGLELCKASFIWILRFPTEEKTTSIERALPQGFQERVKDRGVVVKWVPQTVVLAHESIGGFVSHCGWGSVNESAYFGVPVVAMPMRIEQPFSCRMLVEAGFGVEVVKDANGRYSGEEIANAIDKVIADKEFGEGIRLRTKNLSDKIRGSEEKEKDETVEQITRLCLKKRDVASYA